MKVKVVLSGISHPVFTVIDQLTEETYLVHLQSGVQGQSVVVLQHLVLFGHHTNTFSNALIEFPAKQQATGNGRTQISD